MRWRRTLRSATALALAAAFTSGSIDLGSATTGQHPKAETPGSQVAIAFSTQGATSGIARFTQFVSQHGYQVTQYIDTPGDDNPGPATVFNFANTSGSGLLHITSHGGPNGIMVEQYTTPALRDLVLSGYIAFGGYKVGELTPCQAANGSIQGICITPLGIANHWQNNHTLVFAGVCQSASAPIVSAFNAREYFGYLGTTCAQFVSLDTFELFGRMSGVLAKGERRAASAAYLHGKNTGLISGNLVRHAQSSVPLDMVLSPAVSSHDPAAGTNARAELENDGFVEFDARMDTSVAANSVIAVEAGDACDGEILEANWSPPYRLRFKYQLELTDDEGSVTFRVKASAAKAERSFKAALDGNQNPSSSNHVGPNGDDFTWSIKCVPRDPNLAIRIDDSVDPVAVGEAFSYVIAIVNKGPEVATGVTVEDVLAAGFDLLAAAPSQGVCDATSISGKRERTAVRCTVDELAVQSSATVELVVVPRRHGVFRNTATVRGNEPDKTLRNNSASEQTTVTRPS